MTNNVHYMSYSYAIYDLAKDLNKISEFNKNAHNLLELICENNDIIEYLSLDNNVLPFENKELLIDKMLEKNNPYFINSIKVIVQSHQCRKLNYILKALIKKLNKRENILEGFIYTTQPLTKIALTKIEKKLSTQENKVIKLKNLIDDQIIAGYRITFEDRIIENSIFSQLKNLKHKLLKEEHYEN